MSSLHPKRERSARPLLASLCIDSWAMAEPGRAVVASC